MAGSRLIVHADVHDALVAKVAERARAIRLGDPTAAETEMGPVANQPQYEKVLGYLRTILANFSRTALTDQHFVVSQDGDTVFMEAKGDLIQAGTGVAYHNVYVFKFVFANGAIVQISEYANPVTFAKLTGLPIG